MSVDDRAGVSALRLLRRIGEHLEGQGLVALDGAGVVVVATPGACRLLGLRDDSEGRSLEELGADFRVVRLAIAAAEADASVEKEIADHRAVLLVKGFPVIHERVAVVMLIRDITRLRELERVRRDFVTNVSHELRTPIAAIQLMVQTLESGALDDREVAAGFISRIGLEVGNMAQMVEELLELSAIESGARTIQVEEVAPDELAATTERLRPLADERGVALLIEVALGTPHVLGDRVQLGQVLRNLVHNAIKFTPSGGSVTLALARSGPGRVEVRCSDTGVGILPDDLPRIFERFWKADASRRRDGEGTGLGLAIARHAVEMHGGTIRVESEPRRGSTFIVELPAAVHED